MTKDVPQSPTEHYIVPARQLSGRRDEVLAQIDDLIVGLLFGGIDQVLQEATLTAEYKFADGFLARAEFAGNGPTSGSSPDVWVPPTCAMVRTPRS